jgi:hypothetical protein
VGGHHDRTRPGGSGWARECKDARQPRRPRPRRPPASGPGAWDASGSERCFPILYGDLRTIVSSTRWYTPSLDATSWG